MMIPDPATCSRSERSWGGPSPTLHCEAGSESPSARPPPSCLDHLWRKNGGRGRPGETRPLPEAPWPKPNRSPRGWAPERKSEPRPTWPARCDGLPASLPASSPVRRPQGRVLSLFQHSVSHRLRQTQGPPYQPSAPRPCPLPLPPWLLPSFRIPCLGEAFAHQPTPCLGVRPSRATLFPPNAPQHDV